MLLAVDRANGSSRKPSARTSSRSTMKLRVVSALDIFERDLVLFSAQGRDRYPDAIVIAAARTCPALVTAGELLGAGRNAKEFALHTRRAWIPSACCGNSFARRRARSASRLCVGYASMWTLT